MDWNAGDLEELNLYTFAVDDLALRGCTMQNEGVNPCCGESGSKPTAFDLARSRVRNDVKISGVSTKLGRRCDPQDDGWDDATQDLARTLGSAALIMFEDGENWKVIHKQ